MSKFLKIPLSGPVLVANIEFIFQAICYCFSFSEVYFLKLTRFFDSLYIINAHFQKLCDIIFLRVSDHYTKRI